MSISKLFLACSLALGSLTLCLAPAAHSATHITSKAARHEGNTAAPVTPPLSAPDEERDEPATDGSAVTDFNCELGNKITIYQNPGDENFIALRWKKRLHRLKRVSTSTGALRFENKLYGLIWIGIPAKGMLLDSKQNRQLANECKSAEQVRSAVEPKPASAEAPVAQ